MCTLTPTQLQLLSIMESFMHNKAYELPEDFDDVQQLFRLAQLHKLGAVVYEQIRTDRIWKKEEYINALPIYKKAAVRDIMLQIQRTEGFLSVYEQFKAKGIYPLVMKGMICRNLYSKSDYRISGDEDMLLPREQFATCDEILVENGFYRELPAYEDVTELPYEIPYINRETGTYIELHFALFPEGSGAYGHLNDEFQTVHENKIAEKINGKEVWTLSPTDHIFYLICHSFKHFLHSGFGIRQVADMMMMAEHYGNAIEWNVILSKLERLNMKKYWEALLRIGVEHLGFSLEKASYPKKKYNANVDYEPLLKDLLDSGIYGDATMERKHSSNMTLTAAAAGKANTAASIKSSLFPSVDYMKKQYAWLEKQEWQLPFAYALRIARYLKNRKETAAESIQIGTDRVELLKKYEIIE